MNGKFFSKILVPIIFCMIISACNGTSSSDIGHMNPEDSVWDPDVDLSSLENENPEGSTGIEEETVVSEHQKILSGQIGTVNFTALSENDKANFNGKEMIADAEYIEKVFSSDVYYCAEPLKRMEVHPILEWGKHFESYTISDEILGIVESTEAEEPFRIYDIYPEGPPMNCVVFYFEDGSCGTFSLGYRGTGEEITREEPVYENYESMKTSRVKDLETSAVNWILDGYHDIAKHRHNTEVDQEYLRHSLLNGDLPAFGELDTDNLFGTTYMASEYHFEEVCSGEVSEFGSALIDLNNDGTDELVIGLKDSYSETTVLYAAYNVKGGKIQTIFQGWARSRYYLKNNGAIVHGTEAGATHYLECIYELVEDESGSLMLKEVEAIIMDEHASAEGGPYYYYPNGRGSEGVGPSNLEVYETDDVLQLEEEAAMVYKDSIMDGLLTLDMVPLF